MQKPILAMKEVNEQYKMKLKIKFLENEDWFNLNELAGLLTILKEGKFCGLAYLQ